MQLWLWVIRQHDKKFYMTLFNQRNISHNLPDAASLDIKLYKDVDKGGIVWILYLWFLNMHAHMVSIMEMICLVRTTTFFFKYIRLKIYVFIDIEDSKYRKECSSESPTWRSSHGVKMKIVAWVSKTSIIDGWIITGTESPHFTSHSSQHKYYLTDYRLSAYWCRVIIIRDAQNANFQAFDWSVTIYPLLSFAEVYLPPL